MTYLLISASDVPLESGVQKRSIIATNQWTRCEITQEMDDLLSFIVMRMLMAN